MQTRLFRVVLIRKRGNGRRKRPRTLLARAGVGVNNRPRASNGARARDQKFIVVRTPNTAASCARAPLASATPPPGLKMYWKSGCTFQPEAIWY